MIFCIGIYEVEIEKSNVIQIPRAWRKRIEKADSLYCKIDEYVSNDDEKLIKMTCSFDRACFIDINDDYELFTIPIDRKHRMHIPQKCIEKCGFQANDFVLLMGWGEFITIQAKRDKLKLTDTDELEQLIYEINSEDIYQIKL